VREAVAGTRNARARDLVFRADKLREDAAARCASAELADLTMTTEMLRSADSLLARPPRPIGRWLHSDHGARRVAFDLALRTTGDVRRDAFNRARERAEEALASSVPTRQRSSSGSILYFEAARPISIPQTSKPLGAGPGGSRSCRPERFDAGCGMGDIGLVRAARGDLAQAERDARTGLAMDTYLRDAPTILLAL
jgi:hypothetical protein